jgi:hypothetical protein
MADIVVTPTSVVKGANATITHGYCGETIAAGKAVYRDSSTGLWMLADSNGATAAKTPGGIALNGGAINQPVAVQTSGEITIGATLVAGSAYYLSETPGGIQPVADLAAGETVSLIGIAKTTGILNIDIQASGVSL